MVPSNPVERWWERRTQAAARRRIRRLLPEFAADRSELLRFGKESDREFTALAHGLAGLDTELTELRAQSEKIDLVLHGQDDDRALDSASEVYRRSVDLVHASMGLAVSEEEQMETVDLRLLANRERFVKNSLYFRVLTMFIKTETARLSPENQGAFVHVAMDISEMVRRMTEVSEQAFSKIEAVVAEGAAGRDQITTLQADLQRSAERSVTLLRGEFDRLKAALEPCVEGSRQVAQMLAETRTGTASILTSLQYQDIVRQQLEHIAAGFEEILALVGSDAPAAGDDFELGYLHQAIRLQQTHLCSSRASIEKAGQEVTRGLNELLRTGGALVEAIRRMEAAVDTAFRKSNLADLFKVETERLVEIARQSEQTNDRIGRLVEEVEKFAGVLAHDISGQEFEVRLVALNAEIAAARLSSAGALTRLAQEISRLSDNTADLTRTMTEELGVTLSQMRTLRTESDDIRQTLGREKEELAAEAAVVSGKLARLNEGVQRCSSDVGRKFSTVYDEVRALLPTLQFPTLIELCYGPAERMCEQLLAQTAPFAATGVLSVAAVERLDAHKDHYTMNREHEAHAAALSGGAATAGGGPLNPAPAEGGTDAPHESYGNGVELF